MPLKKKKDGELCFNNVCEIELKSRGFFNCRTFQSLQSINRYMHVGWFPKKLLSADLCS